MFSDTFDPVIDGEVLTGDNNNNIISGTPFNDRIFGLGGNDRLLGRGGSDLLEGGLGNDILQGGLGEDKLEGGIGNDYLFGQENDDWLFGDSGNDRLYGNRGNDDLNGGEGRDTLFGDLGNDVLDGGLGNDLILLGDGSDIVVLAPGNGFDEVLDFRDGHDQIHLDGELTFEDLQIVPNRRINSIIRIDKPGDPHDGESLALLKGVRPGILDIDDFIQAPSITAALENDTGVSDSDGVTKDPSISGNVTNNNQVTSLKAGFGEANVDAVTINPTVNTTVTTENIPEASVFVAAGTLETMEGGLFTGELSITEVPRELTPAALPENLFPDVVVTIQPGEMVFTTPAPLSLPNLAGYAPGTEMDLWSINPTTGEFDLRFSASRSSPHRPLWL